MIPSTRSRISSDFPRSRQKRILCCSRRRHSRSNDPTRSETTPWGHPASRKVLVSPSTRVLWNEAGVDLAGAEPLEDLPGYGPCEHRPGRAGCHADHDPEEPRGAMAEHRDRASDVVARGLVDPPPPGGAPAERSGHDQAGHDASDDEGLHQRSPFGRRTCRSGASASGVKHCRTQSPQ